jgi:hypothetical protein
MTSRSDGLRANPEQLNRRREKAHERQNRRTRSGQGDSGGPVRRAVMLPYSEHMRLSSWCQATAAELGLSRITGQDVLRTLVVRLLTDPSLANELLADLAARRAKP